MGFEPTHFVLTKNGPYHLAMPAFEMERAAGFEPVSLVDGNHVFYLVNFARKEKGVPARGTEPIFTS